MAERITKKTLLAIWAGFAATIVAGGYFVYFDVLGIGSSYQRSPGEAQLSLLLFGFGVYVLALAVYDLLMHR